MGQRQDFDFDTAIVLGHFKSRKEASPRQFGSTVIGLQKVLDRLLHSMTVVACQLCSDGVIGST